MALFALWFSLHEPRLFLDHIQQKIRSLGPADELTQLGKLRFFREMLPAMSAIEKASAIGSISLPIFPDDHARRHIASPHG